MQPIEQFDFFPLVFDKDGKLTSQAEFEALKQRAARASDVILLAHGFRNDANDATGLYTRFLTTFRKHLAANTFPALAKCDFAVAGVYWPSKLLPEEFAAAQTGQGSVQGIGDADDALGDRLRAKLNDLKELAPESSSQIDQAIQLLPQIKTDADVQDKFVDLLLSTVHEGTPDPTEGFQAVRNEQGSTVLRKLSAPVIFAATEAGGDSDGGSVQGISDRLFSVLGGVDKFVNLTTWWIMKNRSGVVGANGVAQCVRDLTAGKPSLKIHLVGHSLGGRLMAACAKSLSADPMCRPASLSLLEAAFSHYGFAANNGRGTAGFFRDVVVKQVVKGPAIATFSAQDTVVGTTYSLASRVALDNSEAVGDAMDQFGGIGRNGCQKTAESTTTPLLKAGSGSYAFSPGKINCLDGSGGLIKDHGDVTNEDVTYAVASVVAATQAGAAAGGAT